MRPMDLHHPILSLPKTKNVQFIRISHFFSICNKIRNIIHTSVLLADGLPGAGMYAKSGPAAASSSSSKYLLIFSNLESNFIEIWAFHFEHELKLIVLLTRLQFLIYVFRERIAMS